MNEHARRPAALFDDFVASRPDEERWELIEGSFVMQASPTLDHQSIAQNIAMLLARALASLGTGQIALQSPTIDLTPVVMGNKFVPDVAVLDAADFVPGRHTISRCYLAVEIISPSDRRRITRKGRRTLDIKRDSYQQLSDCQAILLVEQDRYAVTVGVRVGQDWDWTVLTGPDAELDLAGFGMTCRLSALYERTSLAMGHARSPRVRR